ncbi:CD209 antigen-like protein D [Poeciliopsis prolifica]|uniref:CD209 antigen-like protein D n=1 Tax=Poeciliopsis prolifica TaxID=188132 RepID=UPI00241437D3|nr:CD209 antigen-like protein D [Poeciliopsis prolifica]
MSLITYLGNAIRLSRAASYTPSGPGNETEDRPKSIPEYKRNRKHRRYMIIIKILSGLLAIMMSLFIREFVQKKHIMTSLEEMRLTISTQKLPKILSSQRLDYIWGLCNRTTLHCSRCLPGWTEHASRCFFMSKVEKTWENARRECLDYMGDLAVVLNDKDQAFLTKMAFRVKKASPSGTFHSAWIGLQDLVREGDYFWVNGNKLQFDIRFWKPRQPNNEIGEVDPDKDGEDCVSIVPPNVVGDLGWMYTWDDIICTLRRHYICETDALILDGSRQSDQKN